MAEPKTASPDSTESRVAEAVKAHARGWKHTPARGKRPFLKEWQLQPDPSLEDVQRWARAGNLGIRTGRVSDLCVIDDDTADGSAARTLGLPPTVTAVTGKGRKHYYFRLPAAVQIGNSTSRLAANVDAKCEGGMVIAVGSIHPETGRMYEWALGLSPEEIEMAELPAHIAAALAKKKPKPERFAPGQPDHERLRNYARVAFQRHVESVGVVPEGQRNNILNRAAFVLGRFVGAGLLDRHEVEEALYAAARSAGLEEQEVRATIRSGIESGISDPHDLKVLARKAGKAIEDGSEIPIRPRPDEKNRPLIVCEGGKLPEIVDAAEKALLKDRGQQLYQRESLMVRMVRSSNVQLADGIRRPVGALTLMLVEPAYLVERFTRAASFQKFDSRLGDYKIIDCPERVANTYLARKGFWNVPVLRGVVEAPTLRPDGTSLQAAGYDPGTGLYFDPGMTQFRQVPEHPTLDDARAALADLLRLLIGFPFVAPCDRAAALAAILTGLIRRSLRTAPMFGFRAPTMGTGKSLLADIVAMFATGRTVPAMPQGKDEDEFRKRMLALLIEGDPVCCIDNIERPLSSSALCSVLTQETWKDRVLGKTGMATVPTCTTMLATGNNLVFVGDLTTRVVVSDLDAGMERPEERTFNVNLYEYVPVHRDELVPAALTILRGYHVAGRPGQRLTPFGRFESWSDWVRSALVWVGESDPCEGRKRIEAADPVRRDIQAVFSSWWTRFKDEQKTVSDLVRAVEGGPQDGDDPLRDSLRAIGTGRGGTLDPRRIGHWLQSHDHRVESGVRLERVGERQGVALWRLIQVAPVPGGCVGSVGSVHRTEENCQSDQSDTGGGRAGEPQQADARHFSSIRGLDPTHPTHPTAAVRPDRGGGIIESVVADFDGTIVDGNPPAQPPPAPPKPRIETPGFGFGETGSEYD
jgi:hypothetical protein